MVNASGYVSIQQIINRVMRTFPAQDFNYADFVTLVSDALRLIGSFEFLEDDVIEIDIEDYRGDLPYGIAYINATRDLETKKPYRYSSNAFHSVFHKADSPDLYVDSDLTYTVQGDFITCSEKNTCIEMSIKKHPVDDNGYPLIPNNINHIKAVETYLTAEIGRGLFYGGKIAENIFLEMQREAAWYVGKAEAKAKLPSHDQMETYSNILVRLIDRPMSRDQYFTDTGSQERIRLQP